MELQVFVSNTIKDIVKGLEIASNDLGKAILLEEQKQTSSHLDFDVAVTVENNSLTGGDAKAGISVAGIDLLGSKIQSNFEQKNSNLSRIKFSVWIQQR